MYEKFKESEIRSIPAYLRKYVANFLLGKDHDLDSELVVTGFSISNQSGSWTIQIEVEKK